MATGLSSNNTSIDFVAAEITADIVGVFGRITRQKAYLLQRIGQFDALGLARRMGASTTAMWLIQRLGVSNTTAHEYVKLARALRLFALLERAFGAGEVSYSKVRLVLPYMTEGNEEELVGMARSMGYHELEIALAGRPRNDDGERERPRSYVRMNTRPDGRVKLWAEFSPSEGAQVMAALKLGEIAYYDTEVPAGEPTETLGERLDGIVDDLEKRPEVQEKRRAASGFGLPLGKVLLSSFMGMVNMVRARPKNPLRTPAAHVNIVVTSDGRAFLPNNSGAGAQSVANLVANGLMRVNTVDETGLVLNTGRSFRLATDAQVNALMVMWGGMCAMPGCTHSRFMEMHHIQDWADGGTTDLDNLLPLCSACHGLVTDGWARIVKDSGDVHFILANGARFVSTNHGIPVRCDDALTLDEFTSAWSSA
ncbi:HNH endonuclease signature motif containing protein [Corynebacterium capitovis]|uniref:HNH endonuclease signature motif containing protein n=1 Tax=Corynebacterium capitovis TaxID=131081 RepID=UPI0003A653F7|nr:HNH endonuclease signature motif containing protein [Corynebacterium capitovis]